LLKEKQNTFEKITDDMVEHSNNKELLNELSDMHKTIDDNNYQSTTVEKSYKITMDTLHEKIFKKLANADDENKDKNLILFAKIITGKDDFDIDDNLRNPELAQQAIITVMQRKN